MSSEISNFCEISNVLVFVSYFASQSKGIKFGDYFFDVIQPPTLVFSLQQVTQPPTLLWNVPFFVLLLTSVVQNVCRLFVLWTWCLRAKIHYYYTWPFAKKLYHSWISTMTSSNEISWNFPPNEISPQTSPPKWRVCCTPACQHVVLLLIAWNTFARVSSILVFLPLMLFWPLIILNMTYL